MNKLDRWKGYVPDEELEVYRKAGFGERIGFGAKAALARLTEVFRRADLPIYHSRRGDRGPSAHRANLFGMDMKFADVEDLDFVVAQLKGQA